MLRRKRPCNIPQTRHDPFSDRAAHCVAHRVAVFVADHGNPNGYPNQYADFVADHCNPIGYPNQYADFVADHPNKHPNQYADGVTDYGVTVSLADYDRPDCESV